MSTVCRWARVWMRPTPSRAQNSASQVAPMFDGAKSVFNDTITRTPFVTYFDVGTRRPFFI
jgi:hypothetical protein